MLHLEETGFRNPLPSCSATSNHLDNVVDVALQARSFQVDTSGSVCVDNDIQLFSRCHLIACCPGNTSVTKVYPCNNSASSKVFNLSLGHIPLVTLLWLHSFGGTLLVFCLLYFSYCRSLHFLCISEYFAPDPPRPEANLPAGLTVTALLDIELPTSKQLGENGFTASNKWSVVFIRLSLPARFLPSQSRDIALSRSLVTNMWLII